MRRLRDFVRALAFAAALLGAAGAAAQSCPTPGSSGPGLITGIVNTYYAGSGTSGAGASAVSIGALDGRGAATPIAAGDLLIVMQMQDGAISTSNSIAYGGSGGGRGYTTLGSAGRYEYAVATGGGVGFVSLASPLANTYTQANAGGSSGQRRYQVIRVPQYSSAQVTGTVTAPPWNGTTGGVVAFDVSGALNWGGQAIDVTGLGFRGGGAQQSQSDVTGAPVNAITDYFTNVGGGTLNLAGIGSVPNGAKGEGVSGTPILVWDGATGTVVTTGTAANDGTSAGYPGGSFGRGGPGNGGGGGTDGSPTDNQENTGGAGGANYGIGGKGGFGWIGAPALPPGDDGGGIGGMSMPVAPDRMFMGGGGGAGSSNNGTGTPGSGAASSGAPGGGLVLIRAGTTSGAGTISARGAAGNTTVMNDASGGGGAGGSVLLFVNNGGAATGATVNIQGGNGGSNNPGAGANCPHGPGGGGSGGYAALSGTSTVNAAAGAFGTTCVSPTTTADYGSTSSVGGFQIVNLGPAQIPGAGSTNACFPQLTVTKSTASPFVSAGAAATYTVTVANLAGRSTASTVTVTDPLPANPDITYAATSGVVLAGGAARSPVVNPVAASPTPAWGTFSIPGGGSVAITFTANVAASVASGVYQNPANVTYLDPTRTNPAGTVTPGGAYAGGGTAGGSNYVAASTTNEDVSVVNPPPTFTKSFAPAGIAPGGPAVMTIVVNNPNALALANAGFVDTYPAGMQNTAAPAGASSCGGTVNAAPGGGSLTLSGATIPASGTCTVTANVTITANGTYVNTLPVGTLTNTQNITNTVASSATLSTTVTVAKTFNPIAVAPNADATLALTITNPNTSPVSLANPGLTDTFPALLVASGGAVAVTGAGCAGFAPATITAGVTSFTLTAGAVPAGGACTVSFAVRSATAGIYNNTSSGVTTTAGTTGPVSNTASLGVGLINIAKAFGPATIQVGGTSTITYTLANPTGVAQTAGAFLDTMINMVAVGGAVGGTCTGTTPASFTAGATAFNFTGINIPPAGCTVTVAVTSSTVGSNPNAANGVTTALLPQGPGSNTDNLIVVGKPTITKAFAPTRIAPAGTATATFSITNPNTVSLTGASFTDPLPAGLAVSGAQSAGGTCAGAATNNFANGQSGILTFSGLGLTAGATCTVTVQLTAAAVGNYPNTATGVASTQSGTAGTASNIATLVVASAAGITKTFGTPTINQGGTSLITFALTNSNTVALTNINFTDNLTNMTVGATGIGGSCVGTTNAPALSVGATAFNLTVPTLAAGANCTITVTVTSAISGTHANTTSGVSSNEAAAGAGAPPVSLTVLSPPQLSKNFVSGSIESGGTASIVFTLVNPNATALTNVVFSDTLVNMSLGAGTAASDTCAGSNVGAVGVANLSTAFTLTLPTLNASETCTITVTNVTSTVVSPAGGHPNTTSTVASTEANINRGAAATGFLNVFVPPTISKTFTPASIPNGGTSTVVFTLTNPNSVALTDVRFTDNLPANLLNSAAQTFVGGGRGTCTSTIPSAKVAGNMDPILFTSTTVPANGSCTILMDVTSTVNDSYTNTVTSIRSNQTPTVVATGGSDVLSVGRVVITKSFRAGAPGSGAAQVTDIQANQVFWLWVDLTNQSGGVRSNIAWTDNWAASATGVTVDDGDGTAGEALVVTQTGACTGRTPANVTEGATAYNLTDLDALAINATCVLGFPLRATTPGLKSNTVTCTAPAECDGADTATIRVWSAPTIAKSFSPATIGAGATSTVTLTLANPAGNPGVLSNASFTDTLANMSIAGAQTAGGTCVGTTPSALANGATALAFSGISIPQGGSCTVTFVVTSTTPGTHPNTASGVTTAQTPTAGTGSGAVNLTVVGSALAKAFVPASITAGTVSRLTFTITNGVGSPAQSLLTFTDTLPANVVVASPANASTTCTAGTVTAAVGSGTIALAGARFDLGDVSCTVGVDVTSAAAGSYTNNTANISGLSPGLSAAALTATLTVAGAPTLTKAFVPASIAPGTTALLTFTITNSAGNGAKAGLGFTDTFPANVVIAATPGVLTNCPAGAGFGAPGGGMGVTAAAGTNSIAVAAAAMNNAVASCQVRVNVTATTVGAYTNNSTNISALAGGLTAAGVNATLTAVGTSLAKSFTPPTIGQGGVSTMTFTITNGAGNPAQSGLQFTENLPANVFVAAVPALANTCGGTVTATPAAGIIPFTGGSLAAGVGSCAFSVNVTSAFAASYLNDASRIVSAPATMDKSGVNATLTVLANPVVAKAFAPTSIAAGANSTLTITLTNANGTAATGAALTDTLPAGVTTVAASAATTCGGTASQAAGSVSLTGGTIPANGACTLTVGVTSAVAGAHLNTIAAGGLTTSNAGASTVAASDTLTVVARPTVAKVFAPAQIGVGGTSTLTITLTNPNPATAITAAAFTDTMPAPVTTVAATAATTCGGTASQAAGSVSLAGGTIPANGSCTVTVNVTSATVGAHANTIAIGDVTTANGGANVAPANGTLTVLAAGTLAKSFVPASIIPGATSVLTIQVANPNATPITGAAFNDTYPAAIVNTGAPAGAISGAGCTGTVTAANNGSSVALSGATIPANTTCTVTVNVTSSTVGVHANTTGALSTTNAGAGVASGANLTVVGGITATKAFVPTTVQAGQGSTLTITLTNPNVASAVAGIAFTDTYPAGGITNAAAPAGATTCPGGSVTALSNAGSVALSGATLAAGANCTVTVQVTGVTAGAHLNSLGNVTAANAPAQAGGTATLDVYAPPAIAKAFGAATIAVSGVTSLTLTLTNPAGNPAPIGGLAVSDALPAGLQVASPVNFSSTCGGTVSPGTTAGDTVLTLTGGNALAAGASCQVQVDVTATTAGAKNNTTGAVSAAAPIALTGGTANATLTVLAAPVVTKSFGAAAVALNGNTTLTVSVQNTNAVALAGVAFTDTYPAGLQNTGAPGEVIGGAGCTGTLAAAVNGTSLALTGGTVPATTTCTYTVNVTGITAGAKLNATGAVASTNAPAGASASATLNVFAPPTISKVFGAAPGPGGMTTLTFTLGNPAANPGAVSGIGFIDVFPVAPAAMTLFNTTVANTCAGSAVTDSGGGALGAGDVGVQVANASLAAGASCSVGFNVTIPAAGAYNNTSGAVTATTPTALTGNTASAILTAVQPTLTKAFAPATLSVGGTTTLVLTLANGAGNPAQSGLGFTDTLPAGLRVALAPNVQSNCPAGGALAPAPAFVTATALGSTIVVAGAAMNATVASCEIRVAVTSSAAPTTGACPAVNNTNGAASLSGLARVVNGVTDQCVTVNAAVPDLVKGFTPATLTVGGSTTLTFTVSQPTGNPTQAFSFTDTLPSGLVVGAGAVGGTCSGGTVTATAGTATITVAGRQIVNPAILCTITVPITTSATPSTAACPVAANTNGNTSITGAANLTNSVSDQCVVVGAATPTLDKAFAGALTVGGTQSLTFTISQPVGNPTQAFSFTDTLPAGLVVGAGAVGGTCSGGGVTATAGTSTITVAGRQVVNPATSCTIVVPVAASATPAVGACPAVANTNGNTQISATSNITAAITNSAAGGGTSSTGACVSVVAAVPDLTKAFTPATLTVGGTTTLTFTVTQPVNNPTQAFSFTDTLPAGLVVGAGALGGTCSGGTITAVAGSGSIAVAGRQIVNPAASCTITVPVTTSAAPSTAACPVAANTNGAASITGTANLSNGVTDQCVAVSPAVPALTKAFAPTAITIGGAATLTFTLSQPAGNPTQAFSFTDTLPAGLAVGAGAVGGSCSGGTVTATAGTSTITVAGRQIVNPAISCTITVPVTNSATPDITACPVAANTNGNASIGATTNVANNVTDQCLSVGAATPILDKAFAGVLTVGGTQSLTFTISQPAANPTQAFSFTDTLPAGLVVGPGAPAGTCSGGTVNAVAGSSTITVTGRQIVNPAASCTIVVPVTTSATPAVTTCPVADNTNGDAQISAATNLTAAIANSAAGGGTSTTGACVSVVAATPALTKAFAPASIAVGGTTTLTFTVSQPAGNPTQVFSFVDTLPAGLAVAAGAPGGTCSSGSVTATAGSNTITVANRELVAPATSCTVTVPVTTSATPSTGACPAAANTNAAASITGTANLTNGVTDQCVTVAAATPSLTKAFSPASILLGQTTTLTFTVTQPAGNPTQAFSFTDTLPAGLAVAVGAIGGTCSGGSVNAVVGSSTIAVANRQVVSPATSCTITVPVTTSATPALATCPAAANTNGNASIGGLANLANNVGDQCVSVASVAPTLAKAFSPATIASGGVSTLTITVSNPNAAAITVTSLVDTFPATPGTGLARAPTPAASTTCTGGAVSSSATSVTLTGGAIAAGGACTFQIDVTAPTEGSYVNTLAAGALASSGGTNTAAASATLTVTPVANLAIVKLGPANAATGGAIAYTISVTNAGPDAANNASFADTVPAQVSGVSALCGGAAGGAACGAMNVAGNVVTSTIPTLPAGGSVSITVSGTALGTGTIINTATIAAPAGVTDPVPANNSSSVSTTLQAPDLTLTKTHAGNFSVGTNGTYTITASNAAGSLATSGVITVTDTLPAGLGFVSATGAGWTCGFAAGTVTCTTPGPIAAGAMAPPIALVVSVASIAVPSVTNTAAVSGGGEPAGATGNNGASDNTLVFAAATSTFAPNGAQTAMPGTVVFYPHIFTAGVAGSVAFTTSAVTTPAIPGWTQLVYRDTNCNGTLDGAEGTAVLVAPVAVNAGDTVCIVVKESIPANAPYNSLNSITVTATLNGTLTYTRNDVTTVGAAGGAGLTLAKTVRNVTQGGAAGTSGNARPNDILEYTITYTNTSSGTISAIVVTDATPAFTTFQAAACAALPANLSSCVVSAQPAVNDAGSVVWTLGGTLLSNGSGSVTYMVRVAP